MYPAAAPICTKCTGRPCLQRQVNSCALAYWPQMAFFLTLHLIHKFCDGCKILYYLWLLPLIFLIFSPLTLYFFTPAVEDSWVSLQPTRPTLPSGSALLFLPLSALLLLRPPDSLPHLLQEFAQMSPSQWADRGYLFKNCSLSPHDLGILNFNPLFFPLLFNCHNTTLTYCVICLFLLYYKQISVNEWIRCFFIWHKGQSMSPNL